MSRVKKAVILPLPIRQSLFNRLTIGQWALFCLLTIALPLSPSLASENDCSEAFAQNPPATVLISSPGLRFFAENEPNPRAIIDAMMQSGPTAQAELKYFPHSGNVNDASYAFTHLRAKTMKERLELVNRDVPESNPRSLILRAALFITLNRDRNRDNSNWPTWLNLDARAHKLLVALTSTAILQDLGTRAITAEQAAEAIAAKAKELDLDPKELLTDFETMFIGGSDTWARPAKEKFLNSPRMKSLRQGIHHPESLHQTQLGGLTRADLPTIEQGKMLVKRQERVFEKFFGRTPYENYKKYTDALKELGKSNPELSRLHDDILDGRLEIRIYTQPESLPAILSHGYLNLQSGGERSVNRNRGGRNVTEATYMDADVEMLTRTAAEARPHYGMFGPSFARPPLTPDLVPAGSKDGDLYLNYGDVVLIIDPSRVADRLTWVSGDTGNALQRYSDGDGVERFSLHAPTNWDQTFIPWSKRELMLAYLGKTKIREFSPTSVPNQTFSREPVFSKLGAEWVPQSMNSTVTYFEAQIFGPITHEVIQAVEFTEENPPSPEILERLRELHIEARITSRTHWKPAVPLPR